MYEWGKVKKVMGNKTGITSYSWTVWLFLFESKYIKDDNEIELFITPSKWKLSGFTVKKIQENDKGKKENWSA